MPVFFKFLLIGVCFVNLGFAGVEDHLKVIGEKPAYHRMRNVDFIYMINLDRRPEKWELSQSQLNPYGIYPFRFSAVNGWELSLETINDVGLKFAPGMEGGFMATSYKMEDKLEPSHEIIKNYGQTYFCHSMARGTIGIVLSHLSVLQDAYDSGYETVWIMEDDVEVLQDPRTISTLIDRLDEKVGKGNWDILFTDRDVRDREGHYVPALGMARRPNFNPADKSQYYVKKKIDGDFMKIGARFGSYSMIVRRRGMEKILSFFKEYQMFLPYDMDNYLHPGIQMYCTNTDVVSNLPKALSDNGSPNYVKKLKILEGSFESGIDY